MRTLLLSATFLSAALLFVIQPLFAKTLLPEFGGTSSVWTVSVFFYSAVLLLGYIYASVVTRWPARTALIVHGSLLVLTSVMLLLRWFTTGSMLVPALGYAVPSLAVLGTLFQGVGLPVVLLASTSVITQHLWAQSINSDPYRLYAVSNAGSLLGLATYPFLLEPFSNLTTQAAVWTVTFLAFMAVLSFSWWRSATAPVQYQPAETLSAKLEKRWVIVLLAAIPTVFLAASTEYLSKGIASFPLLWVIPLLLYLLSFIVAFGESKRSWLLPLYAWAAMAFVPAVMLLPFMNASALYYWAAFASVMAAFFTSTTYLHRKLYERRPRVSDLGPFYVWLTFGGALGSGLVGFVLPLILSDLIEVYILVGGLAAFFFWRVGQELLSRLHTGFVRTFQGVTIALSLVFVLAMSWQGNVVAAERNFFGTLKVYDYEVMVEGERVPVRSIVNGATNHGMQARDARYYEEAASYYGPGSGIDVALRSFIDAGEAPRVAVVGLGAGMMNAYCDRVSKLDYVEINPAVEQIARDYFTYLTMCPDKTSVVTGDGRLALAEAGEPYDIIMMDAFTDDAIPVHLLTKEAFEDAYLPTLAEGGVLAFHVSNKYLKLHPPIVGAARELGYEAVVLSKDKNPNNQLHQSTVWVLVGDDAAIETLGAYERVRTYDSETYVWTDERNSVMRALSLTGGKLE